MGDLHRIFGKGAWPMIERDSSIVVFAVDYTHLRCSMLIGGDEYTVHRTGVRQWSISRAGYNWELGSQWEVLAWIGDRL